MRKFALFLFACTVALPAANVCAAQQVDITISGSTLKSPFAPNNDSVNFHSTTEKNGTYVGFGADIIDIKKFGPHHIGLNFETAWRYRQANYPYNGESYRPIFSDVNALYESHLGRIRGRSLWLDLTAGVGIASTPFNIPAVSVCTLPGGGCINYTTTNHFMEDLGVGLRYRLWRKFFIRPEVRYYHIQNNYEFDTDSIFRLGASLGYTFGGK